MHWNSQRLYPTLPLPRRAGLLSAENLELSLVAGIAGSKLMIVHSLLLSSTLPLMLKIFLRRLVLAAKIFELEGMI